MKTDFVTQVQETAGLYFRILGHLGIFEGWDDFGLTMTQLRILFNLRFNEPYTMTQIAELLEVSTPTATGLIDRLERKGLIVRQTGSQDRRRVLVRLSREGHEAIDRVQETRRSRLVQALERLSPQELTALRRALEPLWRSIMIIRAKQNKLEGKKVIRKEINKIAV